MAKHLTKVGYFVNNSQKSNTKFLTNFLLNLHNLIYYKPKMNFNQLGALQVAAAAGFYFFKNISLYDQSINDMTTYNIFFSFFILHNYQDMLMDS